MCLICTGPGASGAVTEPYSQRTYTFTVPPEAAPTDADPACLTYVYQSHVDPVRDVHSGLIGPLLVCKPGSLDASENEVCFCIARHETIWIIL
jgi:hypothetical protein